MKRIRRGLLWGGVSLLPIAWLLVCVGLRSNRSSTEETTDAGKRVAAAMTNANGSVEAVPAEPTPPETKNRDVVAEFDSMTDRLTQSQGTVTSSGVDAYARSFRALPSADKAVCIRRAINLISDENILFLVGILLDRETDRKTSMLIFDDILKRDDDIKKTVLGAIDKDKSHPCWNDAHWILEATGELKNNDEILSSDAR